MLAGEPYIADDPELAADSTRILSLAHRINAVDPTDRATVDALLAELLGEYGEDVQIGPNVQLLTATHPLEPGPRRDKWEAAEPITIADNVWLGGGVIVCPGVTIGENTVVGAGSVVTRDLPADVVAVGSPARVVREL
jgi:maltose O-acetyltransferase